MFRVQGAADRLGSRIICAIERVCIGVLVALVILIWFQVFYRYLFHRGVAWVEEIAKYLMVWMALLGASIVLHENGHVSIDLLKAKVPNQKLVNILILAVSVVLYVLLTVSGFQYAIFAYKSISPASGISKMWAYLAIPIGGIFLIVESAIQIVKAFASKIDTGDSPSSDIVRGGKE
jgi:TRAP-type C4-dicarboxylate transport system permease small subunit